MIEVLVADDHPAFRACVRTLIDLEPDMRVVEEVASGESAVSVASEMHPHVVVLDLSMPGMTGTDAIRELVALESPPGVVVLTMHRGHASLGVAVEAGARGYVAKTEIDRDLVAAIRDVAAGGAYLPGRSSEP